MFQVKGDNLQQDWGGKEMNSCKVERSFSCTDCTLQAYLHEVLKVDIFLKQEKGNPKWKERYKTISQ